MRAAQTDAEKRGAGSEGRCWQWGDRSQEGVGDSCPEEVKSEHSFYEVGRWMVRKGLLRPRGQHLHRHGSVKQQSSLLSVDCWREGGEPSVELESKEEPRPGACILSRVATSHRWLFKFLKITSIQ